MKRVKPSDGQVVKQCTVFVFLLQIVAKGIPMYARMIHTRNGKVYSIPYGKRHQVMLYKSQSDEWNRITAHYSLLWRRLWSKVKKIDPKHVKI